MDDFPQKLAFCITDLDAGGAEKAFVELILRLSPAKWQVKVFCLGPEGEMVPFLKRKGITVVCFGAGRWWHLGVLLKLIRELQAFRPALLQTFLFHANLLGRIAAWKANVRYCVGGIRVAERRPNGYLWLDRLTQRLVDKQVCVSKAVYQFSVNQGRLAPDKLIVIPNGVELSRFRDALPLRLEGFGIHPNDQVWLTVGRLDQQKDPWTLLQALAELCSRHPQLKHLWAGAGPLRAEVQAWIEQRSLTDRIKLIGWQSDIPGLMKACDGLVLTSRWEGMPNVVLEAMAAALPVIATDVEGVRELVLDTQSGYVVPPGDVAHLSRRWGELILSSEKRHSMGCVGQDRVAEIFSWDRMAEAYQELYVGLLNTS